MEGRNDRLDLVACLLMVALCALWGMNQVSVKVANAGIPPVFQAGLRSAGATLLLMAWSRWRGIALFGRDGTLGLGVFVGVLFAGEFALLYGSLQFTNASRASLFIYLAPFVVALGGHFLIPGERLRAIHVLGLVLAFAGMAIAFADALRLPTHREVLGDTMALAAAFLWGATTVAIKATRLVRISPHKTLFYQLAVSALLLPALAPAVGEHASFAPSLLIVAAFLYQTVVIAFISYLAWFWLIQRYPAFKLSAFSFLTPLLGLVAGGVLLGETITPALEMAVLLVGAGIYLVNRSPMARAPAVPAAVAPSSGA
jgi:drug/metabolite transporter (DMT)-like permease